MPIQIKIDGLGVLVIGDGRVTTVGGHDRPVGTVQFTDGNTVIGTAPVIGGNAFLIAFRPAGSHVTAVFTPAPGAPFNSSTSNTVTIRSTDCC